jgi:two-component system response regulator (stage 0 sporulation protein A)
MEFAIKDMLIEKGFKPNLLGFNYLAKAIELYDVKMPIVRRLYPQIAEIYNATPARVERSIRHSIEQSNIKGTNAEVIALLQYQLKKKECEKVDA